MKVNRIFIGLIAIFSLGIGTGHADVATPQLLVSVELNVVEASVAVTANANGLNFGKILPHLSNPRFVQINVNGVGSTDNPMGAQAAADGAAVDTLNDTMVNLLGDPTEVLLSGTTRTAGGFILVSDIASSVSITFADTLTLTSDVVPTFGAAETMDITAIRANSNVAGNGAALALTAGVANYIHIGGVLHVGAAQGRGTYTNAAGGLQVDIALN